MARPETRRDVRFDVPEFVKDLGAETTAVTKLRVLNGLQCAHPQRFCSIGKGGVANAVRDYCGLSDFVWLSKVCRSSMDVGSAR
jgi:hypothetical protein